MASHRRTALALVAGILFALGLALGGMTQPAKVIAFLDVAGDWDPSLIFVLGAGVLVYMVAYRWVKKQGAPLLAKVLELPTRSDIDARLVIGSALFGAGWGLVGYCPGPGLTALGTGAKEPLLFVLAMVAGMALFQLCDRFAQNRKKKKAPRAAEPTLQPR